MLKYESLEQRRAAVVRVVFTVAALLSMLGLTASSAWAAPKQPGEPFPKILPLPNGWQPEGIVAGRGTDYYVGSLANGAIYRGDFRTGEGEVLVMPPAGEERIAVGLAFDPGSKALFVSGGTTGQAFVYDGCTGAELASYQLTEPGTGFINDVIVTRDAAYFTNSFQPVLYRLPLPPAGEWPDANEVEPIPLPDEPFGQPGFAANGIEATPDGRMLVVVHSGAGALYRIDTATWDVTEIVMENEEAVPNGDGLLLKGNTLYVVQNSLNQIAVVELAPDWSSGTVLQRLTDPDFRVPTTVTGFGDALYAVNARFDITPGPDTEFEAVRVAEQ
jgi:sugar lactone lactonase YvrE